MDPAREESDSKKDCLISLRLLFVAEPPFQIVFVAPFFLFIRGLLCSEHLFSSFEKVLLGEGQAAALTRILLDCRVIT